MKEKSSEGLILILICCWLVYIVAVGFIAENPILAISLEVS
jgi:hypothetical protein